MKILFSRIVIYVIITRMHVFWEISEYTRIRRKHEVIRSLNKETVNVRYRYFARNVVIPPNFHAKQNKRTPWNVLNDAPSLLSIKFYFNDMHYWRKKNQLNLSFCCQIDVLLLKIGEIYLSLVTEGRWEWQKNFCARGVKLLKTKFRENSKAFKDFEIKNCNDHRRS